MDLIALAMARTSAANEAKRNYGSPLSVALAADMTDENRVYVYTGDETGYTSGNWYYYNGSAWVSGGVYNSTAFVTDKTLKETGKAADAKVTGSEIDVLRLYGVESKDALEKNGTLTVNGDTTGFVNRNLSSNTGEESSDSTKRCASPYIYIPVGAIATLEQPPAGYGFSAKLLYGANKEYIGSVNPGNLPLNARYIRVVVKKMDDSAISPTEAANALTLTIRYSDARIDNAIRRVTGKNLLDTSKSENGRISNNIGNITADVSYNTSDMIPIASGQTVVISPSVRCFIAFGANKAPITSSYMTTETDNYTYTAAENGYFRFTYRIENEATTQAEYGSTPTAYEAFKIKVEEGVRLSDTMRAEVRGISENQDVLTGKKLLLLGDSIMHGAGNNSYGIGDILEEKYGISFWDYCVSGAWVEYHEEQTVTPVYQQVLNAIAAQRDPDFIIIDGLSNDIGTGVLGEMADDFDYVTHGYSTFGSALEYCFGALRANYPTIPVLYVIPHSSNARNYAKELQFGDLARDICKKWSVPVADVYKDGNMTARIPAQLQAFTDYPTEQSGTHPNRDGYDHAYMPLIINWLRNIFAAM